jgi:hypothetical protein
MAIRRRLRGELHHCPNTVQDERDRDQDADGERDAQHETLHGTLGPRSPEIAMFSIPNRGAV